MLKQHHTEYSRNLSVKVWIWCKDGSISSDTALFDSCFAVSGALIRCSTTSCLTASVHTETGAMHSHDNTHCYSADAFMPNCLQDFVHLTETLGTSTQNSIRFVHKPKTSHITTTSVRAIVVYV